MIIDAVFQNDDDQLNEYNTLLQQLLRTNPPFCDYIIPQFYYVRKYVLKLKKNLKCNNCQ